MTRDSLVSRLNRWLGPLAGLADPDDGLAYALAFFGYTVADPAAVADADLAPVAEAATNDILDVAGWRMLDAILNNLSDDMLRSVGITEDPDKVALRLQRRLQAIYARIKDTHELGVPQLQIGVVATGSIQQDDATTVNY